MNGVNLAAKLLMRQQASKAKLEKLREKTERIKFQDCSFKPKTNLTNKSMKDLSDGKKSVKYFFSYLIGKHMNN